MLIAEAKTLFTLDLRTHRNKTFHTWHHRNKPFQAQWHKDKGRTTLSTGSRVPTHLSTLHLSVEKCYERKHCSWQWYRSWYLLLLPIACLGHLQELPFLCWCYHLWHTHWTSSLLCTRFSTSLSAASVQDSAPEVSPETELIRTFSQYRCPQRVTMTMAHSLRLEQ